MPSSRVLIAGNTLTTSAASVTFSSIPDTYTDLVLKCSVRTYINGADFTALLNFNSSGGTAYSNTELRADGATAASARAVNQGVIYITNAAGGGTAVTANTFNNLEIYIPSYTASQNKPVSAFVGNENNSTTAFLTTVAGLWRNTAAITSLTLETYGAAGSSFFLYGIKNS